MKPITTRRGLIKALHDISKDESGHCALDFETTALSPEAGRVRLVSLCNGATEALVDFDRISGGFRSCAKAFAELDVWWIVFNYGFEHSWFRDAGANLKLFDVQHLRQSIVGGSNLSLALAVLWDLDVKLDKEQQASDWSAEKLTEEQLEYAIDDARITWRLWQYWQERSDEGTRACAQLLNDLEEPVIAMQEAGMQIDTTRHRKLIEDWESIQADRIRAVREMVGEDEVANINSNQQWSRYFSRLLPDQLLRLWPKTEKTGQLDMSTDQLRKVAGTFPGTPLETTLDALADYKRVSKYLSSFGETLITRTEMSPDGRIHARYNIGAARTLRFSCSSPNLQQIPRDQDDWFGEFMSVRESFVEKHGFRVVSLDYSAIELRVLALLSGDAQLLDDVVNGDVHSEVAAGIIGRPLDLNNKADKTIRSNAKRVSFGIIYGSAAPGLAVSMRTSVGRAQEIIDFWEARYPDAFRLRFDAMEDAQENDGYLRMIDGGTIWMGKRPEVPKCANYPVQRAAWTVMARALIRHHRRLQDQRRPVVKMIGTIHDALMDKAHRRHAKMALHWMYEDMVAGYLDVFPEGPTERLVEGGFGPSWGFLVEEPIEGAAD